MSKDDNRIVQSLWIGDELSLLHQTCIQSFINNGHEFHLYTYQKVRNIPLGTVVKDAAEILPYNKLFTFDSPVYKGRYAPFSDLFRYHLLYLRGGWWVDTDVFCLKHFAIEQERVICSVYHAKENLERPSNFIMKFPKSDPFLQRLIAIAEEKKNSLSDYVEIGPSLVDNQVFVHKECASYLVPYYYFAPISLYHTLQYIVYNQRTMLEKTKEWARPYLKPRTALARTVHTQSFGVHLWNEVWRQNSLDENGIYHPECLYQKLKAQYQIYPTSSANHIYEYSHTR